MGRGATLYTLQTLYTLYTLSTVYTLDTLYTSLTQRKRESWKEHGITPMEKSPGFPLSGTSTANNDAD